MPASLLAACFNRRVWVRCPLGNRLVSALLDLFAIVKNSFLSI